jgi:hypothetical protein
MVMIDDVFLHRLIQMVYATYDEWYMPGMPYHKHREMHSYALERIKKHHVQMLLAHYDKERFANCKNLYEERVKFLNEVQQIVDLTGGC